MSLGACHALEASVLVLNKFYMAVHVIPVRRATPFSMHPCTGVCVPVSRLHRAGMHTGAGVCEP